MGTWGSLRSGTTLALTAALALGVTGCAASPPTDPSATAGAAPTATATAPSTPTAAETPGAAAPATPSATPVAAPAGCDTVLNTAEYDRMTADGLTFRQESPNANLDALMTDGGLRCLWRLPNTDIEAWYAEWPSDQAAWDAQRAELLAGGATASADGATGVAQPEYNAEISYRDGTVYYVSPPRLLDSVTGLQ